MHVYRTRITRRQSQSLKASLDCRSKAKQMRSEDASCDSCKERRTTGERRLLLQSGAYEAGLSAVHVNGVAVPVSAATVELLDGSSIRRPTSSVLEVQTAEVRFQLRNSDHFLNMHSAELSTAVLEQLGHIDGLLGQTADAQWKADSKSAIFVQHVEHDFELPAGEGELWSTAFAHNRYEAQASAIQRAAVQRASAVQSGCGVGEQVRLDQKVNRSVEPMSRYNQRVAQRAQHMLLSPQLGSLFTLSAQHTQNAPVAEPELTICLSVAPDLQLHQPAVRHVSHSGRTSKDKLYRAAW